MLVKINYNDSVLFVKPSQVLSIQAKIKARQVQDEKINKELKGLLPSSRTNQFASWIGQKENGSAQLTWAGVKELGMAY